MLGRPKLTILLLTQSKTVRADFGAGNKLLQSWQGEQPPGAAVATSIEAAIKLNSKKPGKRVLVLTSHVWLQSLKLMNQAASGLEDDELAQTLKFEAESFSGIEAFVFVAEQGTSGGGR